MASFQIFEDKNKENSSGLPIKAKNAKQPLGLINTNKINQEPNGNVPAPLVKEQVKITKSIKNVAEAANKPMEVMPVIEQFDASDTLELDATMSLMDLQFSPKSVDLSNMEVFSSESEENIKKNHTDIIKTEVTTKPSDRQRGYLEVELYQKDILANSREAELRHRPVALYMLRQEEISHRMRSILIDWLVSVTVDYQLTTETLYLTVYYIDRFLSKVSVLRAKLQLVGTTALYIASKFEEGSTTDVTEFIYVTDNSYTRQEMLNQERCMLKVLDFNLVTPTACAFIEMFVLMCEDMNETLKFLTMYISELSLLQGDPFLLYLPSLISAAALALARHILGLEMWSPQLEEITTYKMKDLKTVVLALSQTHKSAKGIRLQAIQYKYRYNYKNVSKIEAKELTQDEFDQLCLAYNAKQIGLSTI